MRAPPPASEAALMDRVAWLRGRSLGWLAEQLGRTAPPDLRRHKGWIGQLLEDALGASAGSRAEPDFPKLGVEMKTLPIRENGGIKESTYVCTAPLDGSMSPTWDGAWLRRKLSRVLWVPVIGDGAPATRVIGAGFLWSPSATQEALLRADWEELSDLVASGELWQVDARRGAVLQLRPKAANSRSMAWSQDAEGEWVQQNPLGFYLRPKFTHGLLSGASS